METPRERCQFLAAALVGLEAQRRNCRPSDLRPMLDDAIEKLLQAYTEGARDVHERKTLPHSKSGVHALAFSWDENDIPTQSYGDQHPQGAGRKR